MKSRVNLKNQDNVLRVNCPVFKVSNGSPGKMLSTEKLKAILAAEEAAIEAARMAAKKVTDDAAASKRTGLNCRNCGNSAFVQDFTRGETTCTVCAVMICDYDTLFSN
jgi:hypothetical protein